MLMRKSLYVAALFSIAMSLTAGCATQDIVKKDEGVVSSTVVKQADKSKPIESSTKPTTTTPASPVSTTIKTIAPGQQEQIFSSTSQLQSALEKIYFDFDSANLSESARSTLTKNASVLMKESTAKIRIEGNCDERGSAEYNLALGERRAKSAQQYLQTLGIKPDRLSIVSFGKEKPAVMGSDENAMAKNRRDDFVVIQK